MINKKEIKFETVVFEKSAPKEVIEIERRHKQELKDFFNTCSKTSNKEKCRKCYYHTLSRDDEKGCLNLI